MSYVIRSIGFPPYFHLTALFQTYITQASEAYDNGWISFGPRIWTLDSTHAIESYLDLGARMINTNDIRVAFGVIKAKGFALAIRKNETWAKSIAFTQ